MLLGLRFTEGLRTMHDTLQQENKTSLACDVYSVIMLVAIAAGSDRHSATSSETTASCLSYRLSVCLVLQVSEELWGPNRLHPTLQITYQATVQ
jgi:hypothetical protein